VRIAKAQRVGNVCGSPVAHPLNGACE
jgi:hypothetical protein